MARVKRAVAARSEPAEGPWDLPDGWRWERLEDVAELIRGVTYTKNDAAPNALPTHLPLLRGNNIQNGSVNLTELVYVRKGCVAERQLVQVGDIVLTMSSGSASLIGKAALIRNVNASTTFGAFCGCVRANNTHYSKWIFQFFQTTFYRNLISAASKGTSINNLKREHLNNLPIPMPPPASIAGLVGKLDELLAEISAGEDALAEARAGVETYRKALLKAAVTGELTADWRRDNLPTETGEDLLRRNLADRRDRWKADPKNGGKTYAEPDGAVNDELSDLPKGWTWATVQQLSTLVTSGSRGWSKYYADEGSLFIRAANLNQDRVDLTEVAFVKLPSNTEGTRTKVKKGDFLITITGANVTKCGVVDQQVEDAYVSQHVGLVRPTTLENGRYLYLWSRAYGGGKRYLEDAAYGAGKPGLNLPNIYEMAVALPSPEEQAEIATRVERLLSQAPSDDGVADNVSTLRQSILSAAFRGELTA